MTVSIHAYLNPTAGLADGVLVSQGTGITPIGGAATPGLPGDTVRFGIRLVSDTVGEVLPNVTTISIQAQGTNYGEWAFAQELVNNVVPTLFTDYGTGLVMEQSLTDVNLVVYARCTASNTEAVGVDTGVKLKISCSDDTVIEVPAATGLTGIYGLTVVVSRGALDEGKIVTLNASGLIDASMLPVVEPVEPTGSFTVIPEVVVPIVIVPHYIVAMGGAVRGTNVGFQDRASLGLATLNSFAAGNDGFRLKFDTCTVIKVDVTYYYFDPVTGTGLDYSGGKTTNLYGFSITNGGDPSVSYSDVVCASAAYTTVVGNTSFRTLSVPMSVVTDTIEIDIDPLQTGYTSIALIEVYTAGVAIKTYDPLVIVQDLSGNTTTSHVTSNTEGISDSGKIVILDNTGHINVNMMPSEYGDLVQNVGSLETNLTDTQSTVGGLTTSVGGLVTSVGELTTSVGTLETDLTSTQSTVSGLTTSLGTLETDLTSTQSTVSGLTTSVSGLTTSVGTLETDLTSTQSTVSGLTTSLGTLETSLTSTQSTVGGLTTTVSGLTTSMETVETNLTSTQSTVSGLTTSLGTLETSLTSTQSTVGGLTTTVSGLTTSMETVETNLTSTQSTVGGLTTTVSGLTTSLGTLETNLTSTQSTVSGLTTSLSTLTATVTSMQETIASQKDYIDYLISIT